MEKNLDKDIKILEELAEDTIRYKMVETDAYMAGAITRVLKELETYKKIAEKLAEEWFIFDTVFMIRGKDIHSAEQLLDWARKEVENEQNN